MHEQPTSTEERSSQGSGCSMAPMVEAHHEGRLDARDAASVTRHLAGCTSCRSLGADLLRLRELARSPALPPQPSLDHARRRRALLQAAAEPSPRRGVGGRRRMFVAAAVVLGVASGAAARWRAASPPSVAVLAHLPPLGRVAVEPPVRTATTVLGSPGARFERVMLWDGERVDLVEGSLDLSVKRLRKGERFLVQTTDAEVSVHGTVFHVEAEAGRLVAVTVTEGEVEVRRLVGGKAGSVEAGAPSAILGVGASWRAPERVATSSAAGGMPAGPRVADAAVVGRVARRGLAVRDASDLAERRRPSPSGIRSGSRSTEADSPSGGISRTVGQRDPGATPTSTEPAPPPEQKASAFNEGVRLIEKGDYASAAASLEAFRAQTPDNERAEDAAFLTVVALQRAGRRDAAVQAARRYLDRYPTGSRRLEAQALVASP